MVDMQVIVRHQDGGALRLDHLHDQALCGPKGEGDLLITHIMPMSGRLPCAHLCADMHRGLCETPLSLTVRLLPEMLQMMATRRIK